MRLKELREERELSQWDVANGIQTGQRNIGRWENEEVQPTADFIIKLADFFGVSTDYLLGRSDDFGNINIQSSESTLSNDEEQLLKNFRAMRPDLQASFIGMSETLAQTSEAITRQNKNRA